MRRKRKHLRQKNKLKMQRIPFRKKAKRLQMLQQVHVLHHLFVSFLAKLLHNERIAVQQFFHRGRKGLWICNLFKDHIERGEGEDIVRSALSSKFGRAKFFSEDFFPYALYYLGLLTFEDEMTFNIPNLTIKNMFVDYYDELSEFTNADEARRAFVQSIRAHVKADGTWHGIFEAYWQQYVKARIPAQAFDKMNENFFRTTFTSRCMDVLPMFYSFETEYNSSEGRCDFLAIPKLGVAKPAQLVEFKYFTNAAAEKGNVLGRAEPDAETVEQALAYREALARRPDWNHPIDVTVVEVCGNTGYNWFDL